MPDYPETGHLNKFFGKIKNPGMGEFRFILVKIN